MGDVIADAFLYSYRKNSNYENDNTTAIAFIQAGGVRVTIPKGRKYSRQLDIPPNTIHKIAFIKMVSSFRIV